MKRGRRSQDGEIERLERWQDDKGRETEIKEREAGEEARRGRGSQGEKVSVSLLFPHSEGSKLHEGRSELHGHRTTATQATFLHPEILLSDASTPPPLFVLGGQI